MLLHIAFIAVFGILVPWVKGTAFLDPVISSAYSCMGILFAAPAALQSFSKERPHSMRAALILLGHAVAYGEVLVIVFLAAGILTVAATHGGRLRFPVLDSLAETGMLGLVASAACAAFAAWLTLRFSAAAARRAVRFLFFLLLIAFYHWSFRLPEIAFTGSAAMAAVTGAAVFGLYRELVPK